ncbi:MAG: Rrf2 family transcriptional regulator [Deltaproteobacteria bacterium]|nr:Rrf2 family transcriptional regulator [Deltaproteobacteria bacterium]MBN2672436.1 Rrf2 family transcriptional regulator [Deltaproteobacteria bacterium]
MFLKISDAANLGIHALAYMAEQFESQRPIATAEAADAFDVSANHLSKVLQRLTRAGLVKSVRGPKGGFVLAKSPKEITLRDVYEAIDGIVTKEDACILGTKHCGVAHCVFGNLVDEVQHRVTDHFSSVTLADVINR